MQKGGMMMKYSTLYTSQKPIGYICRGVCFTYCRLPGLWDWRGKEEVWNGAAELEEKKDFWLVGGGTILVCVHSAFVRFVCCPRSE